MQISNFGPYHFRTPYKGRSGTISLEFPFTLSTMFARTSICGFLLHVFTANIAWRRILYLVNGINIISGLVASTTVLTACYSTGNIWNPGAPGNCRAPNIEHVISVFHVGKIPTFSEACLAALINSWTKPRQCFAIERLRLYQLSSCGTSKSAYESF